MNDVITPTLMTPAGGTDRRPALAAALAVLALMVTAAIAASRPTIHGSWWEWGLLTLGAVGAAIPEIRVGRRSYLSGVFVFIIITAAFIGPLAAFATSTIAVVIAGLIHHARRLAILGNCATAALPAVVSAILLDISLPHDLTSWSMAVSVAAASLLAWVLNLCGHAVFIGLLDGDPIRGWLRSFGNQAPGVLLSSVLAGAVAPVYAGSHAVGIVFCVALVAALLYMTQQTASALERAREIEQLAESRRVLAVDAAQAEERERRRIAERVHDGALQDLLTARQDIHSAARGNTARIPPADAAVQAAISQLRQTLAELHPVATRATGVAATLRAIADAEARRGGFSVDVSGLQGLDGAYDRLLIGVGRELLTNVTRHANARSARVTMSTDDGSVMVEVADDGCGMNEHDRRHALAHGHLGLAAITDRVEALGGSVSICSPVADGHGTSVTVRLPR